MKLSLDHVSVRAVGFVVTSLLVFVFAYTFLWSTEMSMTSFPSQHPDELERALWGASMGNRALIISEIDKGHVKENGMLHLFIRSLQEGEGTEFLIKHILFVAVDRVAFNQCRILKLNCYQISMNGLNSLKRTVLPGGFNMVRRRSSLLLGEVLRHGYSFVFTDLDVIWLRNPLPDLSHTGEDMQISCGAYNGQPCNYSSFINSGFYSVSANKKNIALFDELYAARMNSKIRNEQDMPTLMKSKGLKVRFLDTEYFSSLCQDAIDIRKVTTVHANCCPSENAKLAGLTAVLDAWKTYNRKLNVTLVARNACTQPMESSASVASKLDELGRALRGASLVNKTVIIGVLNKAYVEENGMLDLFLRSLREGEDTGFLIKHLLLVAVDKAALDRCRSLGLHCYQLITEGVDFSKEVLYMSEDFIKMMWSRTLFLGDVLRRGYNFIFTDMDVIWLRNPFTKLQHQGEDLQISCDQYNGAPFDESNPMNTGFYYVSSNNKTIELFDEWYQRRNASVGMKEQDVLQLMRFEGVLRRLGVKVRFLDTAYFSGFCEHSRDSRKVATVHANCCRSIKAKLADLNRVLEFWKGFNGTSSIRWPPPSACAHSWW